jgi:hypothetical protein
MGVHQRLGISASLLWSPLPRQRRIPGHARVAWLERLRIPLKYIAYRKKTLL